jgi:hypothetical protein
MIENIMNNKDCKLLLEYAMEENILRQRFHHEHYRVKRDKLYRRAAWLNKSFLLNEENMRLLQEFAQKVAEKEKSAYFRMKKLDAWLYEEIQNQDSGITDYKLDMEFRLYSSKIYGDEWELEGMPFYIDRHSFSLWVDSLKNKENKAIEENEAWLFNNNHNPWLKYDHPLKDQFYCKTAAEIFGRSILARQDVLATEGMEFEINVRIKNAEGRLSRFQSF